MSPTNPYESSEHALEKEVKKRLWTEIRSKDKNYLDFMRECNPNMTAGQINKAYMQYRYDDVKLAIQQEIEPKYTHIDI